MLNKAKDFIKRNFEKNYYSCYKESRNHYMNIGFTSAGLNALGLHQNNIQIFHTGNFGKVW